MVWTVSSRHPCLDNTTIILSLSHVRDCRGCWHHRTTLNRGELPGEQSLPLSMSLDPRNHSVLSFSWRSAFQIPHAQGWVKFIPTLDLAEFVKRSQAHGFAYSAVA